MTLKNAIDIIIIVGGNDMSYKSKKANKMQELYDLKKSYSNVRPKSYTKMSDVLMISNDRVNTLVLTFGVIICSIFLGLIIK